MTNEEAERLAREINEVSIGLIAAYTDEIRKLCDHILSGDYKREIERQAFERAAQVALSAAKLQTEDAAMMQFAIDISFDIRALATTPAKEPHQ